jgi:SPOR domain
MTPLSFSGERPVFGTGSLACALLFFALPWIIKDACFAAFVVQVGAFQSAKLASERVSYVSRSGFPAIVEKIDRAGKSPLTAVLVGPYQESGEAQSVRAMLVRGGIDGFVRFYRNGDEKKQRGGENTAPLGDPMPEESARLASLKAAQETSSSNPWLRLTAAPTQSEPSQAPAPQVKSLSGSLPFSVSGHIQTAAAYTVASPDHWSKLKNTLALGIERELDTDIKLKISGRFSYDGVYDFTNFFPDRVKRDQRIDGFFHESFLDFGISDWNLRFGRQHITWGEVVGLFFADVVSAKDLREFLVPEFDYIRVPQWAARAEYFKGDFKAEAIWIPYTTYDRIGKPGSDFYPFTIPPPPGFRQQIRSERTPHKLSDSSFGLRTSYLTNGWDLAIFYYGSIDSNATFFRTITIDPLPNVSYRPDHERIHQAGLTASKDVGSFVLKGEAIYTWDRFFNVTRVTDADGVVRQKFLDYILSAEIPLPMESRINLQFFQRWFTNHDPDVIPRRVESGASLFASTKIMNEKVEPELLLIHSLNRLDWMARFKVNWYFAKDWRLVAGTAFFGGKELGLFGRFDNRDRVFAELRYSF